MSGKRYELFAAIERMRQSRVHLKRRMASLEHTHKIIAPLPELQTVRNLAKASGE